MSKRNFPLVLASFLLAIAAVLYPAAADAAVLRGGETYELARGTILEDDLYFLGDTLTVIGSTTGDIISLGSHTILGGEVGEDVTVAAGRVTFDGVVRGDARFAGGVITVSGEVFEDLVVVGGTIVLTDTAHVHGDLLVFGDRLLLGGTVDGVVEAHVRTVEMEAAVQHSVTFVARESIAVRGMSTVGEDLILSAPRTAFISETVQVEGETLYTPREEGVVEGNLSVFWTLLAVCFYAIGAAFLAWAFPRLTRTVIDRALAKSATSAGYGFVFLFAVPVIALVLCASFVGLVPGLVLLCAYVAGIVLAMALAGACTGALLAQWLKKEERQYDPAWASLGGVLLGVFTVLPVLGWLLRVLMICLAFGVLVVLAYERVWVTRKAGL